MRLSAPTFVVAVVVLLLGLVALNVADRRFAPKSPEEEAAAQAAQNTPPSEPPPAGSGELVRLPAEETSGRPDAETEVVFGWEWTPEVQADPARMAAAIEALRTAARNADVRLRIVNVDLVPDAPRGLAVNNKTTLELPPSGLVDPSQLAQSLRSLPAPAESAPHSHPH